MNKKAVCSVVYPRLFEIVPCLPERGFEAVLGHFEGVGLLFLQISVITKERDNFQGQRFPGYCSLRHKIINILLELMG